MIAINARKDDIIACQFQNWLHLFSNTRLLPKSIVLQVPDVFLAYLNEDGVFIPDLKETSNSVSNVNTAKKANTDIHTYGSDDDSDDDSLHTVSNDSDDEKISTVIHKQEFKEFLIEINKAIITLNNSVFVKLNWSSPSDAVWINTGTLKCYTYKDILLLLKSSDRIQYDLNHTFDLCFVGHNSDHLVKSNTSSTGSTNIRPDQSILILREYIDINPGMEFRLFIKHNKLIKICQRDCTTYYSYLIPEKDNIRDRLYTFYVQHIQYIFPLTCYIVDVYIKSLTSKNGVIIIDFSPFGEPTNALLFEWSDFSSVYYHPQNYDPLSSISSSTQPTTPPTTAPHIQSTNTSDEVEIAVIECESDVLPSTKGQARGPIDVTEAPDFELFIDICRAEARLPTAAPDEEEEEES